MKFAAFEFSLWVELLQTRAVQLLVFCELLLLGQNNSKHPATSGNNIQKRFFIRHKLKVTNTLSFVTIFYTMTCQPQDYSRLLHFQIIFFLCRYMYHIWKRILNLLLIKSMIFYRSVIESWTEIVITFGQFFKFSREGSVRNLIFSSTMMLILLSGGNLF